MTRFSYYRIAGLNYCVSMSAGIPYQTPPTFTWPLGGSSILRKPPSWASIPSSRECCPSPRSTIVWSSTSLSLCVLRSLYWWPQVRRGKRWDGRGVGKRGKEGVQRKEKWERVCKGRERRLVDIERERSEWIRFFRFTSMLLLSPFMLTAVKNIWTENW